MDRLKRQVGKLTENVKIVLNEVKSYEFDDKIDKENVEFETKVHK